MRQQIEAAIELYYACRYASAITLAGAAHEWLGGDSSKGRGVFVLPPKPAADECQSRAEMHAVAHLTGVRDWLRYKAGRIPICQITELDACTMILQAITSLRAVFPGSETAVIAGFLAYSKNHGADR